MYMHHSFVIILFSIFIIACGEAENEPQDPIVEEEVTYCDCNELAFDLPYNNFYLTEPREGFTGLCENYYGNGNLSLSKNFYKGKVHGDFITYFENGQVHESKEFDMSFQTGDHYIYTENGSLIYHAKYKWGKQTEIVFQAKLS